MRQQKYWNKKLFFVHEILIQIIEVIYEYSLEIKSEIPEYTIFRHFFLEWQCNLTFGEGFTGGGGSFYNDKKF